LHTARRAIGDNSCLVVAAINSPQHCVLSGTSDAIDLAAESLKACGLRAAKLHVTSGFHSPLMANAARQLAGRIREVEKNSGVGMKMPRIPMTSNVTGKWFSEDCLDPAYWERHMSGAVAWTANVGALLRWKPDAFLEVGPGTTLSTLIGKIMADGVHAGAKPVQTVQTMRHPTSDAMDSNVLDGAIAGLWELGIDIDWASYRQTRTDRTYTPVPSVPTYSWEPMSFWKNPTASIYVQAEDEGAILEDEEAADWTLGGDRGIIADEEPGSILVDYGPTALKGAISTVLYCFPYAGGSSAAFRPWAVSALKPAWLSIKAVEFVGRGQRADEELVVDASDATDAVERDLILYNIAADMKTFPTGTSFCFCGFSMGALVALEVLLEMRNRYRELYDRVALFAVAGRAPPTAATTAAPDSGLPEDFSLYSLADSAVEASTSWQEYFLPLLQADLKADARAATRVAHVFAGDAASGIHCPLSIFCALEDPAFTPAQVDEWTNILPASLRGGLASACQRSYYPGGHEFLKERLPDILVQLCQRLDGMRLLRSVSGSGPLGNDTAAAGFLYRIASVQAVSNPPLQGATDPAAMGEPCMIQLDTAAQISITTPQLQALETRVGLVLDLRDGGLAPREQEMQQCWRFATLLQDLMARGAAGTLRLILPEGGGNGMIIGASKAAALEYPDLAIQRLFLCDGVRSRQPSIQRCLAIGLANSRETDVWISGRRRLRAFTARLEPVASASITRSTPVVRLGPNDSVIVTGGTGGVGMAVVQWLLDDQHISAEAVCVLCRNIASINAIALVRRGVTVVQADCSRPDSLTECTILQQLTSVAYIFHLAGILDDCMLGSLTAASLARVAAPKVGGLDALRALAVARGWETEALVAFSSTSSLLGYMGQTNYAAANAALDEAAVTQADEIDIPVVTVNWGPWGEAGMAGVGTKAHEQVCTYRLLTRGGRVDSGCDTDVVPGGEGGGKGGETGKGLHSCLPAYWG